MTPEEAIKLLQQLYPNGGHCWLDEQRTEAIGMAIKALQTEPVSEDLEEAARHYLYSNILYDDVYVGNPTDKDCIEMFKAGANWKKEQDKQWLAEEHKNIFAKGRESMKEQMMKNAETAEVRTVEDFMGTTTFRCVCDKYKVGDKVKLIIIKED